jgi:ATP-dependent helicase/nuclease subunit B
MPASPAQFAPRLAADLAAGATLLTVNNRLARHLQAGYEQQRLAAGDSVWETPDILPLGAWQQRCHQQLLDLGEPAGKLLSPSQERVLWERVIATSTSADNPLLRPAAAAGSAADAYRLLHGWQLAGHPELALSPEGEAFGQWCAEFDRLCTRQDLLPTARLPALLAAAVASGRLPVPGCLWLAGFDDRPPALQGLLDALNDAGCVVQELAAQATPAEPVRLACTDPAEERQLAARWALTRLQAEPAARIAIICPDIQGQREPLRQALLRTLRPDSLAPGANPERLPFNFSLGLPLADQPLVRDALLALGLLLGEIEQGELAQLLRSPFLGEGLSETQPRALFDAELKARGFPRYTLFRLRQQAALAAPEGPLHCPALFARLDPLAEALAQQPAKAVPSHWAAQFQQLLALWGWPGERPLSSHEYQQSQAFNALLGELARLDRVAVPTGARLALARLQQLARDTLFQPEGSDAPLQVLGVLEAAGQTFDHLWLLGLDDNHWPPAPAPNPLLPGRLQRELGLPHGSAERELRFARQVLDRLLGAAPETVLSHAANSTDGEQGPSPLIEALPVSDAAVLGLPAPPDPQAPATLQPLDDWQAPPAAASLPGGTPLLADQAACPFRAFAHHRLAARALESVSHGPDPRLVGNMVHQVLENVWRALDSQQALLDMPEAALAELVDQAVSAVVASVGRARPDLYGERFSALERQRLAELVSDWLDRERERAPFRVLALEQRDSAVVGPLTLRTRADRVDELPDGRVVVIDYKTGRSQHSGTWTEQRPEEPQVPLYAVRYGARLAAAALGRVRIDKDGGFKGLASDAGLLPGVKPFAGTPQVPDWAALAPHWQTQLTALAEEVVAGRADPTPSPRACGWCDLASLCRVALMDGNGDDTSNDDGGGGDD